MPILDAQGQPLPPSGAAAVPPPVNVLDRLCQNRDEKEGAWDQAEERYEAMLRSLEPESGNMLEVLSGKRGIDATQPAGQLFVKTILDVTMMTLLFRHRAFREIAKQQAEGERGPALAT